MFVSARPRTVRRLLTLVFAATVLAGCSGPDAPTGEFGTGIAAEGGAPPAAVPVGVTVQPSDGAGDIAPGDPVVVSAAGLALREVTLADPKGERLDGQLDPAGSRWSSSGALKFSTRYTVTSVAADRNGVLSTKSSTFTTVTPKAVTYPSVIPLEGETTGVGIPIIIKFSKPVTDHAAALRKLTVSSDKPAVGAWRWFGDDEVHYRTKDYWPAYSKVTVDIGIGGVALGNGVFGETSRRISFTIGPSIISKVSDKDKQLRAYKDGELVQTAPVSLGKPSARSLSGTLLVMTVQSPYTMNSATYGVPADSPGGYSTKVDYALRVTNSGQFLHSAPWSVAEQGRVNVSHGCININTATAKWFYENSHRGDVMEISDTGEQVKPGDGWTDWRFSWEEWTKP